MTSPKILDSHIHLWPGSSVSPTNHGWMTPGHIMAKRHGISEYNVVTSKSPLQPSGFIYVETDRYLPAPRPDITDEEVATLPGDREGVMRKLSHWAHEPLEELRFLRRMVHGTPEDADGFLPEDSAGMVGCVIWAPFHLSPKLFNLYLEIAKGVCGPALWLKVVGFRFLLQGIKQETALRQLLQSQNWLRNILRLREGRNGKGWTFDIGVDTHGGGVWQVEAAADMVATIRDMEGDASSNRVTFVLNHLCKPDLSVPDAPSSARWLTAMKRLAAFPDVYMKLSGAFNEFAPAPTPSDVAVIVEWLDFYTRSVFELFGSRKIMFGSDWPVCNIGGLKGEQQNWALWRDVVAKILEHLPAEDAEHVWSKTACEAYGVEV